MLDPARQTPAALPDGHPPVLAVIVDTEEEFDWTRPLSRANRGVTAIAGVEPAHEAVFDPLGLRPDYVIDYPVAADPAAMALFRRLQDEGRASIGAHLHPWVNPPETEAVTPANSYPGNLPRALEEAKLRVLTDVIAQGLGRRPTLYKAGRYGAGPNTAALLEAEGYEIDASVVPHVSFAADGGPDFRRLGLAPSWFGTQRRLLELPLTSGFCGFGRRLGPGLYGPVTSPIGRRLKAQGILSRLGVMERIRLTPEGSTTEEMQRLIRALLADGHRIFTLTFHSPSLVPGHTPYVRDGDDLAVFLAAIRDTAAWFRDHLGGTFRTAGEIRALCREAAAAPSAIPSAFMKRAS
ncbi:Glycosyltransferase [Caenispirillum salinarum AK4]|uniref:Glycosyltransferase n=1 Tax=Caenispirillum salinarum AK4 TaxID=1238182 RepID=K9H6S2_9PROT|nr:polysaccharide deacetylase family protein [Caenispirillum salinarum]EKV32749.1 Glycosyltransferase [Caenispirillum salinarum AK4]